MKKSTVSDGGHLMKWRRRIDVDQMRVLLKETVATAQRMKEEDRLQAG